MLNELSRVVEAIERSGATPQSRHPQINPMGKNRDLLVVCVAGDGAPSLVEALKGEIAATLFRVEHGSAGSSFPGFNLPTPLRRLDEVPAEKVKPVVENLLALAQNKNAGNAAFAEAINQLFELSMPRAFTPNQEKQFQRSCLELVATLQVTLSNAPAGLKNFLTLLTIIDAAKPSLTDFSSSLAQLLAKRNSEKDRSTLLLFQDVLFGVLDWEKRLSAIGTPDYFEEKIKKDRNANQPVYLDLAEADWSFKRVAHRQTSTLINEALLRAALLRANDAVIGGDTDKGEFGVDAYSGQRVKLQDKFPSPKIAKLGNLKLFSVNTNEVPALRRYGLEGEKVFPVSAALAQKMNNALLYLASDEKYGYSCRAIPSAQPKQSDLLVAYLEGEPESGEYLAEMFGGESSTFSDADFAAITQPVIEMLEGKVAANPNLNVCLLSFCSIDKSSFMQPVL